MRKNSIKNTEMKLSKEKEEKARSRNRQWK